MATPSVSFLEKATGNTLQGNTIHIQHTETSINESEFDRRALDDLLKHCCLGAQVDSNERFDPPRCDPETRLQIIQDIMDWITSKDEQASIMVLYGPAGAGKSALEQSISQRCQEEGCLASSFFLSRTAANALRSDGDTVIPTLVYQHIQAFPSLKEVVLEEIKKDPGIFEWSREVLFNRLFVKHFQDHLELPGASQPRLIAIDGLDECSDRIIQQDLLRIIAASIPRLRHPFRFVIACRPELHLMQVINDDPLFKIPCIHRLNLGEDTQTEADIRLFIVKRFEGIRKTHPVREFIPDNWPSASVINKLVMNASGQFIYADTVMRFIELPNTRPEDQLKIILAISPPRLNDKPFSQLDAVYSFIFSCVKDLDTVWRILGILRVVGQQGFRPVYGKEPVAFPLPDYLEQILAVHPGDVYLALADLPSVISFTSGSTPATIKILHASLFDFLLDPARSGVYALDLALAHETLALWRLRDIDSRERTLSQLVMPDYGRKLLDAFLFHCQFARLTETALESFEQMSFGLLGLLDDLPEYQWFRDFGDKLERVHDYDRLLRRIAAVYMRKDFPHVRQGSLQLISVMTESWAKRDLHNSDGVIKRILAPKLEAPEWGALGVKVTLMSPHVSLAVDPQPNIDSGKNMLSRVLQEMVDSICIIHPLRSPPQSESPKYLGRHVLDLAQELRGTRRTALHDIQHAIAAARLLFWMERLHHDVGESHHSFPDRAAWWLRGCSSEDWDLQDSPPDAAFVLLFATILAHASPSGSLLTNLEESAKGRKGISNPLEKYPKISRYYREQVNAYFQVWFIIGGQRHAAYNHCDSYPDGLSRDIVAFLLSLKGPEDYEKMARRVRNITVSTPSPY
ncbi:hypothetical protein NLJ89_g9567 [Agrocybe chaxingu]|uniref:Nephrocystin 3-like N-terminal domain-containing protein n=1 Tax=Agrocybe chaxingu TaxID=84603 RepID=A0A9W8MPR1_9AGAR|nr:hypothetical protein NLJ89_g9567 [Agrocybe chaxingu]